MKKIKSSLFLLLVAGILCSCAESNKLNRKYGVSFNSIREKNGISILPKSWHVVNPYFRSEEISWMPTNTKKGFVAKGLLLKNNVIDTESDTYHSGKEFPSKYIDHRGQKEAEYLVVRYFYDKTGKSIYKIECYTNSGVDFFEEIPINKANEILIKWGITPPKSIDK